MERSADRRERNAGRGQRRGAPLWGRGGAPPHFRVLARIGVYAILDTGVFAPNDLIQGAREMAEEGVQVFQVRAKGCASGPFLDLCVQLRRALPRDAWLLANDRADVALLAGLDGVHVGDDDLPLDLARRVVGPDRVVGVSTHTVAEVEAADPRECTYIGFGPIFETPTKKVAVQPHGIAGLAEACRRARVPVVAIGGIRVEHLERIRAAGASGAAMISGLLVPGRVREMARMAVRAFERGEASGWTC